MITDDGIAKIIDFGFGKKVEYEKDKFKSISLNWWCETPNDFIDQLYDEKTEIYFIGKLFEQLLRDYAISYFSYNEILKKMIEKEHDQRYDSFKQISELMLGKTTIVDNFEGQEKRHYREFADSLMSIISKIEKDATYYELSSILPKLEDAYQRNMLEEEVQNVIDITRSFINGSYYTLRSRTISVYELKNFIDLIKQTNKEKQRIIMLNLYNRLNKIERYTVTKDDFTDDIPF
jgi:serine/threonine-protein kinase